MVKRYKLKRRSLYYEEEREFKNFLEEFFWIMKFKINGWECEKLNTR